MTIVGAAIVVTAIASVPVVAAAPVAISYASGTGVATATTAGTAAASASSMTGTVVSLSVSLGPVGWFALGAENDTELETLTFDCWKPVLHDVSSEPSRGKLLNDVIADSRIKDVVINPSSSGLLPEIILTNIWEEKFLIQYVTLPSADMALHAVRLK